MASVTPPPAGANPGQSFAKKFADYVRLQERRGVALGTGAVAATLAEIAGGPVPPGVGLAQGDPGTRAERQAVKALDRGSHRLIAPPKPDRWSRRRRKRDPKPDRPRKAGRRRAAAQVRRYEAIKAHEPELALDLATWGDVERKPFRRVARQVWVIGADVTQDTSGRAWRYYASQQRNKPALGAIRRAALVPTEDGATMRTWASETARRIAALGLCLLELAVPTLRKGPWSLIVRGVPVEILRLLLTHPSSKTAPHTNTLIGSHRGRDSQPGCGQLGYLLELEAAGLFSSQNRYPDPESWERSAPDPRAKERYGIEAWSMNRYWIVGDPGCTVDPLRRAQLIELTREGWAALGETPLRADRRAVRLCWTQLAAGPPLAPD